MVKENVNVILWYGFCPKTFFFLNHKFNGVALACSVTEKEEEKKNTSPQHSVK